MQGSFGVVVSAVDTRTNKAVAIKIIKGHKAFAKQVSPNPSLTLA